MEKKPVKKKKDENTKKPKKKKDSSLAEDIAFEIAMRRLRGEEVPEYPVILKDL